MLSSQAPGSNSRFRPHRLFAIAGACFLSIAELATGDEIPTNAPDASSNLLTSIQQIWTIPASKKKQPHHIRTELEIYYFDSVWNVAWGSCNGEPTFLPIGNAPMKFEPGQRVLLDGWLYPGQERFVWNKTRIEILGSNAPIAVVAAKGTNTSMDALKLGVVSIEGLIDHFQPSDRAHLEFNFLANGAAASTIVLLESNTPVKFKEGDFARITCVYSPQFDRDGKLSKLTLWVAGSQNVTVIGSLNTDPRFEIPIMASERIFETTSSGRLTRATGTVRSHEPGKWVTIWDDTGQIMVRSKQTSPLSFGQRIEAIGYPMISGIDNCLDDAIYRPVGTNSDTVPAETRRDKSTLYLAEEVRDLDRESAGKHPQVKLRGVLSWVNRHTPFVYVLDASGGILVANPKWEGEPSGVVNTIVTVRGEVAQGNFVPVVTNAVLSRFGWWNIDRVRPVSFEQAMTGLEDCQWVEMRGYVRTITNTNGLYCFDLSTSGGDFKVWTSRGTDYDYLKGAIIRVQGMCDAVTDSKHRLTSIQLWVPETAYITVEESAPGDLFDVPLRSMSSLRRFNLGNTLNQRVRVSGTVVLHAPGRYLYVQDGDESIFALSSELDELQPGDKVEVVGLAGMQGKKFLLREATYRRTQSGPEPAPVDLAPGHFVNGDLGGLLATAKGTLLNVATKDGEARLLIQTPESAFEASVLMPRKNQALPELAIGSQLALTGVYELQSDDNGVARSFVLRLRSWKDVSVLRSPSWWTFIRLLWVLLAILAASAMVLSWALVMSRKNMLLSHAQSALQTANDHLEGRVQERTLELKQQVAAAERARAELAEAQKSLMLASRKAGMAEVATGVLHNVGNVLNSVNVSALLLAERIRKSRVDNVVKAGELLEQQNGGLADFLANDPRGKQLPSYLQKLGESLLAEKQELANEVQSLVKCVDHIKVIVGMQQSFAKVGGVLEQLKLEEVVEDAIKINGASLDRHGIRLVRNFQPLPPIVTDRHKVLQILVNLISNAKHAVESNADEKKIIICLAPAGPDRICLTVTDNGIGIAPENACKVFSQGFTTKKDGHGFGLHSGANAAHEMGGTLTVHSDGPGAGATFTLELPITSAEQALSESA